MPSEDLATRQRFLRHLFRWHIGLIALPFVWLFCVMTTASSALGGILFTVGLGIFLGVPGTFLPGSSPSLSGNLPDSWVGFLACYLFWAVIVSLLAMLTTRWSARQDARN